MKDLIFASYDTETTGLLSLDHRIIEIYIGLYRNGAKIFEYDQRIDPQRSIAADAQRVHGISGSDLFGKPTFDKVAPSIIKIMAKADVWIAHNGNEFDYPFLQQEIKRVGLIMPERPMVDTMLEGIWATPDGKKPRLSELCFACGVDYDPSKAHAASYDVQVMTECFMIGQSWGMFTIPAGTGISIAA